MNEPICEFCRNNRTECHAEIASRYAGYLSPAEVEQRVNAAEAAVWALIERAAKLEQDVHLVAVSRRVLRDVSASIILEMTRHIVAQRVDALAERDRETRREALEEAASAAEPVDDVLAAVIRALPDAEPPAAPSKEFEPFGRDWLQQKKEENERGFGRKS